jgi:hypothetical protein
MNLQVPGDSKGFGALRTAERFRLDFDIIAFGPENSSQPIIKISKSSSYDKIHCRQVLIIIL